MNPVGRRRTFASLAVAALVVSIVTAIGSAAPHLHGPPPTPVPPDGHLSPFPSVLHTSADALALPAVAARGALLADLDTGEVLFAKDAEVARPIASVTKIMTALLVLERTDLGAVVTVSPDAVFSRHDYGASSTVGLRPGERVRVEDLLYAMLLGSANDAAAALAIDVAGSQSAFVGLMNRRAEALGMGRTTFASVHGLDDRGTSTPRDLLRLIRAVRAHPVFDRITATKIHEMPEPGGGVRRIQNRNVLLWLYPGAVGTKTGTTAGAGACVIAAAQRDGRRLVAIVLHAPGEPFSDAATLLNYGFEGTTRLTVVTEGESLGEVAIRGGAVPGAAGADLSAFVATRESDAIDRTIVVDTSAAFPPAPGERVGTLVVRTPSDVLGSVPVVVSEVPPPLPAQGPWWSRAVGAVVDAVGEAVAALTD